MSKTKTKRKRRKSLSSGVTRRRKSVRRRKGFLSEMFNPTIAMNSAKSTLAAASGGMGAVAVNKMIPDSSGKLIRGSIAIGAGFLLTALSMPNVGAGFTGGLMALSFQNGLLNENEETSFADTDVLSDQPLFLDEQGNPMILEENNGDPFYRYLDENEMAIYESQQN